MNEKTLNVGSKILLGWNGAKFLGSTFLAHSHATIEAFGSDWIVVRSNGGHGAWAGTFSTARPLSDMVQELSE